MQIYNLMSKAKILFNANFQKESHGRKLPSHIGALGSDTKCYSLKCQTTNLDDLRLSVRTGTGRMVPRVIRWGGLVVSGRFTETRNYFYEFFCEFYNKNRERKLRNMKNRNKTIFMGF